MANRKTSGSGYWRGVLEKWLASGMSQRRFCEERGISLSTFTYWRRRLREMSEGGSASAFIPVEIKPPRRETGHSYYEVRLKNGARIRVPFDFESDSLLRLIGLLDGGRC